MRHAYKPRVLVVHNRDFEQSQQDPENGSRADIRGTAQDVVAALTRAGLVVDLSCWVARCSFRNFTTMSSISAAGTRQTDPADAVFASPCRKGVDT